MAVGGEPAWAGGLPEGACCLPDQTCTILTQASCDAAGGEYHGDGTDCSDVLECTIGQCCIDESTCANTTAWDCFNNLSGYVWSTPSDCSNPCPPRGACCLPNNGGCYLGIEVFCDEPADGVWLGAGTACEDTDCDDPQYFGACCMPDDSCIDGLAESDCVSQGGTWLGELSHCWNYSDCSTEFTGLGACCVGAPSKSLAGAAGPAVECYRTGEMTCNILGGTFSGVGTDCNLFACGGGIPLVGACCVYDKGIDDYVCQVTDRDDCEVNLAGIYHGDGSACEDIFCGDDPTLGACCLPNGECRYTAEAICLAFTGTYQGDFTECVDVPCGQMGACCTIDGICIYTTSDDCFQAQSGVEWTSGTLCENVTCVAPMGQCCLPEGGCVNSDINDCFNVHGGGYWSYPSDCNNPCAPFGACCGTNGCRITPAFFCTGPGDVYKGDDATCADDDGVAGPDVCETCPWDISPVGGDGFVNIDDYTEVILKWGTGDVHADIDGDGVVEIDDYTEIVLHWGPCP